MTLPKRALITGANGFIGRALMARLQQMGVETCGVDLAADSARQVVAGDISQAGPWQDHARDCDIIFHTAAVVSNSAKPELYRAISVSGVRKVLDAAVQNNVPRFIHLSSIAAYGLDFTQDVDETAPITTLSGFSYCDAKAASEHPVLAAHAAGEISGTIIRPGDVYGPGSRPWVLIPLDMIRKNQFLLPANGKGIFSPVYIDNLLDGIIAAATQASGVGQIFNITDGQGITCLDFFSHHYRWLGETTTPRSLPTPLATGLTKAADLLLNKMLKQQTEINLASLAMMTRQATYSIAKAQRTLNYNPAVSLEAGMRKTELWLRETKQI